MHETPCSSESVVPAGFALVCGDHEVPFQRRTSVRDEVLAVAYEPTAVHTVVEVQAMSYRSALVAPEGSSGVCCDQVVPFQRSITGCATPLSVARPTVKHVVAPGQATLRSCVNVEPLGLTTALLAHVVPL